MGVVSGMGFSTAPYEGEVYDILKLGANPDGKFLNTHIIQKAINNCSNSGGGTVIIPKGRFLTGAIVLKSGVTLYLERGAFLLGSTDRNDYLRKDSGNKTEIQLIHAVGQEDIAIIGEGTIDGQGHAFKRKNTENEPITRPNGLYFSKCKNITIEGVFLTNSGAWMQHYHACEIVRIRGIRVYNHCNYNNDGIDINGCQDVMISDCFIDSDDDGICIKSTITRLTRNVLVNNCHVRSFCNALKLGTESSGGFRNVSISNCIVTPSKHQKRYYGYELGESAISIEMVDGGILEQVTFDNITIEDTGCPIFIRLGNRARKYNNDAKVPGIGILRNVRISNIMATTTSHVASSITGIIGSYAENIHIENVLLHINNKRKASDSDIDVPENDSGYPTARMFGEILPSAAFYVRHVKNIRFSNFHLILGNENPLPAFVLDDVKNGKFFFTELEAPASNQLVEQRSDCEKIEII